MPGQESQGKTRGQKSGFQDGNRTREELSLTEREIILYQSTGTVKSLDSPGDSNRQQKERCTTLGDLGARKVALERLLVLINFYWCIIVIQNSVTCLHMHTIKCGPPARHSGARL